MKTLALTLALLGTLFAGTANAQTPTYEGHSDIRTAGADTAYMTSLTHRYVNGELRLLTLTHRQVLHEVRVSANITTTTATWNIPSAAWPPEGGFQGIWFEQAKNRLWIVGTVDYLTVNTPAKVTLLSLGAGGAVTILKSFTLNMPSKRVYGGCAAVPVSLVTQIGGPYVCGWGGYTSALLQGGGASIGHTMYAIPDPDTIVNGATVSPRTVADHFQARGLRRTIPENNYDGGQYLSPRPDGLGYQVWGDSYYNTGMWIGTDFIAVLSACKGRCWYETSTLHHTDRQFEWHVWSGSSLTGGTNRQPAPASMTELLLPRANTWSSEGNTTVGNISGATYDATTGIAYLVGYPMGDNDSGRIFRYRVGTGTPPVDPPPPIATDAVVSAWSPWDGGAWSMCAAGAQTRVETRTRTVVTPATNGGSTPPLSETRTASQPCTVTPPVEPPAETITHADLKTILDRIEAGLATEPLLVTFPVTITSIGSNYANGDRRLTIRVPLASMPSAPVNGATLRVVKD